MKAAMQLTLQLLHLVVQLAANGLCGTKFLLDLGDAAVTLGLRLLDADGRELLGIGCLLVSRLELSLHRRHGEGGALDLGLQSVILRLRGRQLRRHRHVLCRLVRQLLPQLAHDVSLPAEFLAALAQLAEKTAVLALLRPQLALELLHVTQMPGAQSLHLLRAVRERSPVLALLVLSVQNDARQVLLRRR